jgi:hypothetical protein
LRRRENESYLAQRLSGFAAVTNRFRRRRERTAKKIFQDSRRLGHDRLARQAEVNQDPFNHLALRQDLLDDRPLLDRRQQTAEFPCRACGTPASARGTHKIVSVIAAHKPRRARPCRSCLDCRK